MILQNPFADYGGIVVNDRFIGRNTEIENIQNRLLGTSFGNISVVGLPRVGKSSLVWNSIILQKENLSSKQIIPVWISFGEYESIYESFEDIVFEIEESLQNKDVLNKLKVISSKISSSESTVVKRRYIKKYFKQLKQKKFRIIVAFDEFDNAKNILNLQDFQFLRELSYNIETKIGLITISRKSIQELEPDNGALSNFYQIFTDLRLKLFSENDLELYWKNAEKSGIKISIDYKKSVDEFCGKHPYLLDVLNHEIFNNIKQSGVNLDQIFKSTVKELKLKLYNEYEAIIKLMKYEELDSKLIQMVVGPVYDINQRDTEKLLKYDIVKETNDLGYSSFSENFNRYLKIQTKTVDIWPLWSQVELEVRQLIKLELDETFGSNWENGYRLKFEKDTTNPDGEVIKKVEILDGGKFGLGLLKERERSKRLFDQNASDHLIDYTLPRHMFDSFISKNWTWYKNVLKKDKSYWSPIFEHLGKIRNPLAHNNPNFLSDSDKSLADGYCKIILDRISEWQNKLSS